MLSNNLGTFNGTAFIDYFDTTPVNRNIDDDWVIKMKEEIITMKAKSHLMTLTVVVDQSDIFTAEEHEELDPFKIKIIDGQLPSGRAGAVE
jgi:hypothetical protein